MWKDLSLYLTKFSLLEPNDDVVKRAFVEAVFFVSKIQLTKETLSIKNKTVFVENSSGIKSQIFLQRKEILKKTNNLLGKEVVTEVR